MKLGNAIKVCRTGLDLTQAQLSERSGLSISYLSLLEKDKRDPSVSSIKQIASAMNIPLSVLVFLASEADELSGLSMEVQEKLSGALIGLISNRRELDAA